MDPLTTYTVKAIQTNDVWVFKYHLNGVLYSFKVLDGILTEDQSKWLFQAGNFPVSEDQIKVWHHKWKKYFKIAVGFPDLSFESFWTVYDHKNRKVETQKLWKKLPDADKLNALEGIRRYNHHLKLNPWKIKVDPNRYLKHRRWEDEF